jgi:hypothetical protein
MSFKKAIGIWLLIATSYLISFGIPIAAAYYLFAEQVAEKTGGFVFYTVMFIIIIFLLSRIRKILKKLPVSGIKITIQLGAALGLTYFVYKVIVYIDTNTEKLGYQILAVMAALILSYPIKLWAILLDKDYINRIGVFG